MVSVSKKLVIHYECLSTLGLRKVCVQTETICVLVLGLMLAQQTLAADFNGWGNVGGLLTPGTLVRLFLIRNLNFQDESLLLN